jgi:hypothetical protein
MNSIAQDIKAPRLRGVFLVSVQESLRLRGLGLKCLEIAAEWKRRSCEGDPWLRQAQIYFDRSDRVMERIFQQLAMIADSGGSLPEKKSRSASR